MTFTPPTSGPDAGFILKRGADRRQSPEIGLPPYQTQEGLVLVDRRSHLERRACWVRAFALDNGHQEA